MKTSVIISTYNGAAKLPLLLDALIAQTFQDFELVVIVDGSTDSTLKVLHEYENRFNVYKIIEQPNAGRSKVRNRGVSEAMGDLLIFYDDDMVPSHDSVKGHCEFHLASNMSVLLGGNQIENIESQKTDIQNYKAWLTKKWTAKYTQMITQLSPDNLFFSAANCSMQRKLFSKLNGFDERLTDAEDFDFAYRSMENDVPVFFDRTNTAIHNDTITCKSYIERIRQYSRAQRKLGEIHPERKSVSLKTSVIKHWAYIFFAFGSFPQIIDRSNLFMLLPRRIRYRLYSIIIQSLGVEYPQTII